MADALKVAGQLIRFVARYRCCMISREGKQWGLLKHLSILCGICTVTGLMFFPWFQVGFRFL